MGTGGPRGAQEWAAGCEPRPPPPGISARNRRGRAGSGRRGAAGVCPPEHVPGRSTPAQAPGRPGHSGRPGRLGFPCHRKARMALGATRGAVHTHTHIFRHTSVDRHTRTDTHTATETSPLPLQIQKDTTCLGQHEGLVRDPGVWTLLMASPPRPQRPRTDAEEHCWPRRPEERRLWGGGAGRLSRLGEPPGGGRWADGAPSLGRHADGCPPKTPGTRGVMTVDRLLHCRDSVCYE